MAGSTVVIFLSLYSRDRCSPRLRKTPAQTAVIPYGIDDQWLLPTPRSYAVADTVTILYASSIWHYKHHPTVVAGVAELRSRTGRNLKLRIVGGGEPHAIADLRASIRSHGLEDAVTMTGPVASDVLMEEFDACDLFVYASSCEAFGRVLLEAMARRLPIACSKLSGLGERLRDAGVYFNPADAQSLAAALERLLLDEPLRRALGERAYQYAAERRTRRVCDETYDLLLRLRR